MLTGKLFQESEVSWFTISIVPLRDKLIFCNGPKTESEHEIFCYHCMKQSGVMILGWYLCHPVCRRRCPQPPELERLKSQARLSRCHTEYVSLFGALSRIVLAQPLSILPKRAAKHVSSPSVPQAVQLQSSSTISVDLLDGPENSISEPEFGPVTADGVGLNKT
jgi:hypothetical protein